MGPFCGARTIMCESASLGHEVGGTDIDREAVGAARENIAAVKREYWGHIDVPRDLAEAPVRDRGDLQSGLLGRSPAVVTVRPA